METQAIHQTKSLAKHNLRLTMLSWGVLSIIAVIGFFMERFPYQGDSNVIFFVLVLLAIVLLGNLILHIRGVIQGYSLAMKNQYEGNDPAIQRAAILSLLLGVAGAIVSVFLFLGW